MSRGHGLQSIAYVHSALCSRSHVSAVACTHSGPKSILGLCQIDEVCAVGGSRGAIWISSEDGIRARRNNYVAAGLTEMPNNTVEKALFLGHIEDATVRDRLDAESHHAHARFAHQGVGKEAAQASAFINSSQPAVLITDRSEEFFLGKHRQARVPLDLDGFGFDRERRRLSGRLITGNTVHTDLTIRVAAPRKASARKS